MPIYAIAEGVNVAMLVFQVREEEAMVYINMRDTIHSHTLVVCSFLPWLAHTPCEKL